MELVKIEKKDYGISLFLRNLTSENTRKAYATDIEMFFSYLASVGFSPNSPKELTLHHFIAFRDFLQNKDYTAGSINRKMSTLKSLMKWFYAEGHIDRNPTDVLKVRKASVAKPTQAFTDLEVKTIKGKVKTKQHEAILALLFDLGLRVSELLDITDCDINENRNHTVLRIVGKGGKVREVALPSGLNSLMDEYKKTVSGHRLFNLTRFGVYRIIKRYAKEAGITKSVSPHSCRATNVSHLLERGVGIERVAELVGHSDIATTAIYDKKRKGLDNCASYEVNYG